MPIIASLGKPTGLIGPRLAAGPIILATKYATNGVTIDLRTGSGYQLYNVSAVVFPSMNRSGYLTKLVSISGGAFKVSLFKFTATTSGVYAEEANDADISGQNVGDYLAIGEG